MNQRGQFITIEGIEGVGKTTSLELIGGLLDDAGIPFIKTREPGGTAVAESIRSILVEHGDEVIDPISELLLVFAARVQHVRELIAPALKMGTWVVCDRFTDSTYAYQGGGRGLDKVLIEQIEQLTLAGFQPDLTLLLDLDPGTGLERAAARSEKDRFEIEGLEFFSRVRAAYLERARHCDRIQVIDAGASVDAVGASISKILGGVIRP